MVKTYIFCGHLGSGKTEVALNFSLSLHSDAKISLCDLDFVNPYYRSREHISEFSQKGIEIVSSHELTHFADIPGLNKKVSALFYQEDGIIILDVGGDDKGARILGRLRNEIQRTEYQMFWVLNPLRPQTSNSEDALQIKESIEKVSGLKFTSIIFNPNLSYSTDLKSIKDVISDYPINDLGVKISHLSVLEKILQENEKYFQELSEEKKWSLLPLKRFLLNPWEER
jgi:MinD-like ATPase involved in chromosome partitioning or flagellar assembly